MFGSASSASQQRYSEGHSFGMLACALVCARQISSTWGRWKLLLEPRGVCMGRAQGRRKGARPTASGTGSGPAPYSATGGRGRKDRKERNGQVGFAGGVG